MLCQKCGKSEATTHIRSIVNGKIYERYLCDSCAANEDIKNSNLSQMLSSMFGEIEIPQKSVARCSCCGSTYLDVANSGKCGCPQCYFSFYEQLLPYIKRVHGSTEHIGKKPSKNTDEQNTAQEKIDHLTAKLKQYITEEKYEQAAVVRDEIKKLKEGAV